MSCVGPLVFVAAIQFFTAIFSDRVERPARPFWRGANFGA